MLRRREALREVASKSDAAIERETAYKWAARAVACCQKYAQTGTSHWLRRVEDYRHEALEHAALVGDRGATVRALQDEMDREIKSISGCAAKAVESHSGGSGRRKRSR